MQQNIKRLARIGAQTIVFESRPAIIGAACVGGKMEASGPIAHDFDELESDTRFGATTWEKAEIAMQSRTLAKACEKSGVAASELQFAFGGDLLNQCTASSHSMRETHTPYLGLYGACSTFAEGLGLAAMTIDGGYSALSSVCVSSHFCSAERQLRTPLEYGSQRTPTAQWTATAAGAAILAAADPDSAAVRVTHFTPGRVRDAGIADAVNMGAAMAYAAYETLYTHFEDTGRAPDYYDLILTGDLGAVGAQIVSDFFGREGEPLSNYSDCGLLLFDRERQDVHAGASGCGCSASVISGHILNRMRRGELSRVLFAGTGALLSVISSSQGESIPGICHAVALEAIAP